MTAVFLYVVNASLAGGIAILAVTVMRLFLRKAPKRWSYLLWIAPALRLFWPVGITVPFSLFSVPVKGTGAFTTLDFGTAVQEALAGSPVSEASGTLPLASQTETILSIVWGAGVLVIITIGILQYLSVRRRVTDAVIMATGIYESDRIDSPFILGIWRPRIYLPVGLQENTLEYVLAHEQIHLTRKDHWFKLLAAFLVAIHWFNPLVWTAFYLMSHDMEMSCDEAVLRKSHAHSASPTAKAYGEALLSIASREGRNAPILLAFGESAVKKRILNVLQWKRSGKRMSAVLALLCVLFVIGCMVNPQNMNAALSLEDRMEAMQQLCGMQEKDALAKIGVPSSALTSSREAPYGDGSRSRTIRQYDTADLQLILEMTEGRVEIVTVNLYCKDAEELISQYLRLDQTLKETCTKTSGRPYYQTGDGRLILWSSADRSAEAVGGKTPEGPLYILQYKEWKS